MDAVRADTEARDSRFDGLRAEASEAVAYSANSLRSVRDRCREAVGEAVRRRRTLVHDGLESLGDAPADAVLRARRAELELLTADLVARQAYLDRLDLAERMLERVWLLVEPVDPATISPEVLDALDGRAAIGILEAEAAERSRLAREIHDGPAQALTNAIFQVEFIERALDSDPVSVRSEVRLLRDLLRRELGDVRTLITQLRPVVLDERGLEGSIEETVERFTALTGLQITTHVSSAGEDLEPAAQTVILRIVQEALQNVRRHAAARSVVITVGPEGSDWVVEIRDDGRGFDVDALAARGRRNFGLQFMRERAELIGARFDVRSQPHDGTVVRVVIPDRTPTGEKESR